MGYSAVALAGDSYFKQEFQQLIKKYNIKIIVETGTFKGSTAMELSKLVDKVITCEIIPETYIFAENRLLEYKNIKDRNLHYINIYDKAR